MSVVGADAVGVDVARGVGIAWIVVVGEVVGVRAELLELDRVDGELNCACCVVPHAVSSNPPTIVAHGNRRIAWASLSPFYYTYFGMPGITCEDKKG